MKKYICSICSYSYDEAARHSESGLTPGTKWEDVPEDWVCPLCGATKGEFEKQRAEKPSVNNEADDEKTPIHKERELSFGELSALCSNLSKGCEKQYLAEEADLFSTLSQYYKDKDEPIDEARFDDLTGLIQNDLSSNYSSANKIAARESDRGALRALTWGDKVTKILSSLLIRYAKQKDALLENTNVYVCEICGFIYIGDEPPAICPVCKVPNTKLAPIQRGV